MIDWAYKGGKLRLSVAWLEAFGSSFCRMLGNLWATSSELELEHQLEQLKGEKREAGRRVAQELTLNMDQTFCVKQNCFMGSDLSSASRRSVLLDQAGRFLADHRGVISAGGVWGTRRRV